MSREPHSLAHNHWNLSALCFGTGRIRGILPGSSLIPGLRETDLMKSGVIGGVIGSLMGVLLGAAAFRSGTPVDARFTYQGQIRDGEALVSGNVDIRFTLWDAADGVTGVR